ncbi:MAG: ATP-dependent zinc metalloprotease FtsH [Phycisphaerae bacterium]|nr:ATP-dependent zinc metalloprotease FtsH [Phycisphaerae bacterium]
MDNDQKKKIQFTVPYFLIGFLLIWMFQTFMIQPMLMEQIEVPYSQFREEIAAGKVAEVTLGSDRIVYLPVRSGIPESTAQQEVGLLDFFASLSGGQLEGQVFSVIPAEDPDLIPALIAAGVEFTAEDLSTGLFDLILGWILPIIPLLLIWYFLFRRMGTAGAGVMSIGKSKAQAIQGEMTGVKYDDVGGVAEVEGELKEIIEFLKEPERFTRLGAKLPKGVLLVGPPGTGKTLLARATAGEAGVPFFSLSGSDFVEMFVGVGASRVRDLFEQAKAKAPCIVFIDEIDAIGQARASVGALRTNDEREQTLNQLINEMDGFEDNKGVVIMAATNRPEVLDKALLRPGRFDRLIQVPLPTERGRRQILDIHTRDVKLDPEIDMDRLSRISSGFSGADLANIVNEAALLAVRKDREGVTMDDFDLAIERVVAGLQRKMPLKDEVKRRVAYHEGGHALVAELLPLPDQVHKVSIIPTSKGDLGYTMQMPKEDKYLLGERELFERMAVMLGGRAAEMIICNEASTGAANDLERATELARRMVTEFGMSEELGPVRYAADPGAMYLGVEGGLQQGISPETLAKIDHEIRTLIEQAEQEALDLLRANVCALDEVARILQEKEIIAGDEITRILVECSSGADEKSEV